MFINRIGSLIVTYDVIFPSDAIHTFLDVTTQLLESNATIEIDGNKGEVISIQLNNGTILNYQWPIVRNKWYCYLTFRLTLNLLIFSKIHFYFLLRKCRNLM